MSAHESRFRPWLDDPGPWPPLALTAGEAAQIAGRLDLGAARAAERLANLYGEEATSSGALELVHYLGQKKLSESELRAASLAVAAWDHFNACRPLVRASSNEGHWMHLRPYLMARLDALLRDNAADALMWRAIFACIPDNWAPQAELTRALQQEISGSGLFDDVAVTLELNPQVAGGGRWVAMQTRDSLAQLRRRLADRRACLLELIRNVEDDHPATDIVVAYRLEDELNLGRDGVERVRLWVYDPRRAAQAVSLRLTLADDRVQTVESPAEGSRSSVKALRPVMLDPAGPPAFAWHHRLPALPPWRLLWRARRHWLLRHRRDKV